MKIRRLPRLAAAFLATLILSTSASFAAPSAPGNPVRICTGEENGNYFLAGVDIKAQFGQVVLVPTKGSWDNLARLSNQECDAAIVQADALSLYRAKNPLSRLSLERVGVFYMEYVHFITNVAANVKSFDNLNKNTVVAVGPEGSGSWVTFEALAAALGMTGEKAVPTVPLGGIRAFTKVKDGESVAAAIYVTGLNSSFTKELNSYAVGEKKAEVRWSETFVWNSAFEAVKDERGKPVYAQVSIPSRNYSNLQTGFFSTSVTTVGVPALLVANVDFIEASPADYDKLVRAFNKAQPNIARRMAGSK